MTTFKKKIISFWKVLGPGLITGASDDDPSGIATYSQAGAQFGTKLLWTAIVTYPLMVSIQEMCARIGLVAGKGLMGTIKKYYPPYILYLILLVSIPSIILNIGADIAGMGAVGHLIFPEIPVFICSISFTTLLILGIVFLSYRRIAMILKWLCIVLFSYIAIPFMLKINWLSVLHDTLIPKIEYSSDYFVALVGILGTTISPYLFFWQASMEVEEIQQRHLVVDKRVIHSMQSDVRWGMLLTNVVFFFIILTTGVVLFQAGIFHVDTVEEAARALQPLAGDNAYLLFAVGVIGTGLLAVPVLSGALSYMIAEAFDWQEGLDKKFHEAKGFYITLIVSMLVGLFVNIIGISPIKALIYTAVLYGMIAPILIAIILHISNNKTIMGRFVNTRLDNLMGALTMLVMTLAAVALVML
ncbi:Nramp family divalent metal transporter [Flectobacillus roseus]|uniref:Nramp family divalent metal transporter n=1 Tax=Flectobacillus roseus TaxID=502259 RepID=A0ABT6YA25_9BACT|nr:Nramp family divalent metal transporter [Flectobacillus roseus]MDI9860437.1 Nramp family divalent metal transporter [Flectobacillus roseus]